MTAQVKVALAAASEKEQADTIFTSIIQSDIPKSEITVERLQHEAISVVGAGIETTMRTLTITVFHILDNPQVHKRLKQELIEAIPDAEKMPPWETLEKLPLLTACIHECEYTPVLFLECTANTLSLQPFDWHTEHHSVFLESLTKKRSSTRTTSCLADLSSAWTYTTSRTTRTSFPTASTTCPTGGWAARELPMAAC